MLHEIYRKRINVNKHEDCLVSWHNSVFTIRGNKYVHLMDFSYNLQSLEKTIDFREFTITASYESPLPKNYLVNYAAQGLTNLELMEMITNPAFWPHNNQLTQEMTNIVAYKWSPDNLINNNESLLATVNSVGNVELFGPKRQVWASVMNFSKVMKRYMEMEFNNLYNCPREFTELQKAVYSIVTSTICWAPILNPDNSCYLATAQKSGEILIWCVKQDNNNLQTKFCGKIKNMNDSEIITILWIPLNCKSFLLLFSNEYGEVMINECEIVEEKVKLLQEHLVWPHKDKMIVTYLEYAEENGNLILFFNKNRHLIMQLYDKSLKLLSQYVNNINDYKITSITKKHNVFYMCTVNMKIYKIFFSINNDALEIIIKPLDIKDAYSTYEVYGLSFSNNNAILALTLIDRKLLYREKTLKVDIAFLCYESDLEDLATNIINNPSKKLNHIWDNIELFRCKVIKTKNLPKLDYNKLIEDGNQDTYKLKCYLICLIFYHNLKKIMTSNKKETLPETSLDIIKDKILVSQAVKVLKNINEKHEKDNQLSDFDKECFYCSKKYLYFYCKTYSKNPSDYVQESILSLPIIDIKYICQGCDEELTDFTCQSGHLNMFCSLTFTLIDSDNYIVCNSCGATARAELIDQKPTCVFCDLYLTNSCLPI